MVKDNFDTFISYRRSNGSVIASRIHDNLIVKKFLPFYDITGMKAGRFDEQIKNTLINSANFILILSKNALDRCVDEDDWVRQEISLAIQHHLNIVLVMEKEFVFSADIPQELCNLHLYQTIVYDDNNFYHTMDEICKLLIVKNDEFKTQSTNVPITKKINISGDYISIYEDLEDGKTVIRKAPATLVQHGTRLSGTTSFTANQSWLLKGTIYNKKRIAGLYYAKDVLDDGFGTFYLEIINNHVLDGFWSGYDNANHTVTSGRYLFKRKMSNIDVKPIQKRNVAEICAIADQQLGENFINEENVKSILDGVNNSGCICAVDKESGKVYGFCSYSLIDKEKATIIVGKENLEIKYADKIGYLKSVAVDKDFKGYGLGSKLVEECLKILSKQKTDAIICTAWKHAGIINIGNILDRNGFVKRKEIKDYWYESSVREKYKCPQCGNPCHCSCVIYTKI